MIGIDYGNEYNISLLKKYYNMIGTKQIILDNYDFERVLSNIFFLNKYYKIINIKIFY